jgi:hypothetical protein
MIQTSLQEKTRLNVENLSELRAFLVVVHDMIDSRAHGIAPHQAGIVGSQQVGHGREWLSGTTLCRSRCMDRFEKVLNLANPATVSVDDIRRH